MSADNIQFADLSQLVYGEWQPTGDRRIEHVNVPTVINGFGRTIESVPLTVIHNRMVRPVWQFVGLEERWEAS